MAEEDKEYRKNGCGDVDKDWKKTKQTFKRSITPSARPNLIVAPKASTVIPTDMPTPSNGSSENQDVESLRQIRSNHGSYRHISQASKRTNKANKKDRKRNVIGSLASILGPEEESGRWELPLESDNRVHSPSGTKSINIASAAANDHDHDCDYGITLSPGRKRRTSMASKRTEKKKKKNRRNNVMGSLASILGPEKRSNAEKQEQQIRDKFKSVQPAKKVQFNETKVREEIRAKLRKNQQKYDTLAAALTSTKDKTTSNPTNLIASEATPSLKSTRAVVARTNANDIRPTSQEPKLRNRAKNIRLYSVCKRIPLSIPEDSVLEIDKPKKLKNSSSKARARAKASFRPRSPRNSPKSSVPRTRRQRRFSVLTPHPIECGGSSRGNHGGLCMTFPTKNDGGGKLEKTVQTTIRHQRNKRLSSNKWVANQKQ
jgi:hypothetical protein